jgi:hypothetical protein
MNEFEELYKELTEAARVYLDAHNRYMKHIDDEPQQPTTPDTVESAQDYELVILSRINYQEAHEVWVSSSHEISKANSDAHDALLSTLVKFDVINSWLKVTIDGNDYGVKRKFYTNRGVYALMHPWSTILEEIERQNKDALDAN